MPETIISVWNLICIVAIAHVWARGTIFRWARTIGSSADDLASAYADRQACYVANFNRAEIVAEWWRLRSTSWQRKLRLWRMFAGCPLCSGFWIGIIGCLLIQYGHAEIVHWLGIGSLVGTLALALCAAVRRL